MKMKAVASSKLKELKKIDEEFSRKLEGEKKLHEFTHLPKADWCESTATRSKR